jgi:nicotinate-nucleotide adenylyltransferase
MNSNLQEPSSGARIGILGGTFDPPHKGHLAMASAAIEALNLEEVLFLPTHKNPLKKTRAERPEHRLELVKLLVRNHPKFAVSDIELTRKGPSYSVDTLAELQMVRPANYWFIMGSDALKDVANWKGPERLLKMCRLAVINRELHKSFAFPSSFPEQWRPFVDLVPMKPHPAGSTEIRERILLKRNLSDWIPENVLTYIRDNHLYEH